MHQCNAVGFPSGCLAHGTALFPLSLMMQRESDTEQKDGGLIPAKSAFFTSKILECTTSKQLHNTTCSLFGKSKVIRLPTWFFLCVFFLWLNFLESFQTASVEKSGLYMASLTLLKPLLCQLLNSISLESLFFIRANCQKCDSEISKQNL